MAAIDPSERTLPRILERAARKFGEADALIDGVRRWSYCELNNQAQRVARAVIAMGIKPGDRVAIWSPNIAEWVLAALGLQLAGAVMVPLNIRFRGAEAADILRRAGVRMMFFCPTLEKGAPLDMLADEPLPALEHCVLLEGEDSRACSWDNFLSQAASVSTETAQARANAVAPSDIADMLFTSGTTGKPKGVLCTHGQNIRVFDTWAQTVGLRSDDVYLVVNPFFHSFGYKAGWLAALITGCTIIPVRSFDCNQVLALIERHGVTMLPGVPSMYEMILAHPEREHYNLSSLRLASTGAAVVPVALIKTMYRELGFESIVTAYGLTESCGVVSICRSSDDAETIATTSGCAIDGVEIKCVDPELGNEVERDCEGEIWVRGYNVMKGYFEMPEATAAAITADGWLRTGDIGVMNERGYIRITDRLKDMYIMNGENVYPAEVEQVIHTLDQVSQVAVIGVPKQPQGEVGMAFIVRQTGATLDTNTVQQWCAEHLASYKVPYYVEMIDALPLNAMGKVVKPELKRLASSRLTEPN